MISKYVLQCLNSNVPLFLFYSLPIMVVMATASGPPDAPLDVQLEHGPSPGIALISWLPVTIDAAGTSNGVRVTGYTIYADKKKARTHAFHTFYILHGFHPDLTIGG